MFTMKSINQKSILSFFNKKDGSKPTETYNSQNKKDANINGANVEPPRSGKRLDEDMLMIPAKKRKRAFVRQYDEKYLEFGFTVAPVINNVHSPGVWYAPTFFRMMPCNLPN